MLGVASDAAASITTEHERDTWISLIATPLTGTEIVRGKLLGALWSTRHTAVVLVLLWVAGVAAGSVHPLGLLLVALELAAATWFAAALGTWVSLRSTDSMRALSRTLACLLVASGSTLLVTLPLLSFRPLAGHGGLGTSRCCSRRPLASYADVFGQAVGRPSSLSETGAALLWVGHGREMVVACLVSTLGYAAAARGPRPGQPAVGLRRQARSSHGRGADRYGEGSRCGNAPADPPEENPASCFCRR